MKPYISVTGFDAPDQIDQIETPQIESHDIVCAILVSNQSIEGQSKARFPSITDIKTMVRNIKDKGYVVALHYCPKSSAPEIASACASRLLDLEPDMVQINCENPQAIIAIHESLGKDVGIVWQMNGAIISKLRSQSNAMDFFFGVAGGVPSRDCVLYDLSGGRGIEIQESGIEWDGRIEEHSFLADLMKPVCPGVAGGLSPENVAKWIGRFGKNVSIDTEGRVRGVLDDKIVMSRVNAFYNNAIETMMA